VLPSEVNRSAASPDPIQALRHPVNTKEVLRRRRAIKAALLKQPSSIELRVGILGGSTTSEIKSILELFLLKEGIRPIFHESEYNKFYEDAVVDNTALKEFRPDVVFIHTTWQNVSTFPALLDSEERVDECLARELVRFQQIWDKLAGDLRCVVIQNNFDFPQARSLGNLDATQVFGRTHFLTRLNLEFARECRARPKLLIHDINYLSARVGLDAWFDPAYWYSYKMAVSPEATVPFCRSLATIFRALYGRTRKCLVLDLDNTLWGGVIGDDGMDNLKLGNETAEAEAYLGFQNYCAELRDRGILLSVCSKNDPVVARQGFNHPDMVLKLEDITSFKANWEPKHDNISQIARDLGIGLDSLVFVDDNAAERNLVAMQLPDVAVPEVGSDVSRFASILDQEGFFEVTGFSADDRKRSEFYAKNNQRAAAQSSFASYEDFLVSLGMKADIAPFSPVYLERITQLTNKSNQYNLTTRRYTFAQIQAMAEDPKTIALYGRLADNFGDNGLVSVISARVEGADARIDLWLMSCRVLKRGMEHAMLDALIARAKAMEVKNLWGYYYRTPKNGMVSDHYEKLGFDLINRGEDDASSVWQLDLQKDRPPLNKFIQLERY
jgi:FkbH-like protein